jgi:hypothetical protein
MMHGKRIGELLMRPVMLLLFSASCGGGENLQPDIRILAPSDGQELGAGRVDLVANITDPDGEMDITG